MLVSQAVGILFLSFCLWLYWQLITPEKRNQHIKDAVWLTIKVTILTELILFLFFIYAIPIELTKEGYSDKLLSALMLSINSFNNAGLPYLNQFLIPGAIEQSFIIQIGIIVGSTLGSLGIFVIDELLSPKNLRYRLTHPEVDWSAVTKLSVFGSAFFLMTFSGVFYLTEKNGVLSELNLVESIIASIFETSSARGFGFSLYTYSNYKVNAIISLIGAGSFSTGGGFTLLILVPIYLIIHKMPLKSFEWTQLKRLGINLFIYLTISLIILYLIYFVLSGFSDPYIRGIDLWLTLNTNQSEIPFKAPGYIHLLMSLTNIAGRISFIVACYLTLSQIKNQHASHLF